MTARLTVKKLITELMSMDPDMDAERALSDIRTDTLLGFNEESNEMNIPCDCGNEKAYWKGDRCGLRIYACAECHAYNSGLETAAGLIEEGCSNEDDKAVLLCGVLSSKKLNDQAQLRSEAE